MLLRPEDWGLFAELLHLLSLFLQSSLKWLPVSVPEPHSQILE